MTAVEIGGRTYDVQRRLEPARRRAAATCRRCACGSRACGIPTCASRTRAASASCGSPACACARRCGRRCWPSARWPVATSRAPRSATCSSARRATTRSGATGRSGPPGAGLVRDRGDGERGLERLIAPPAARRWTADGWATTAAQAPGLGRSTGSPASGPPRASSPPGASRAGPPRAPRAPSTARRAPGSARSSAGRPTWIEWTLPRPRTLRELRLTPPRERVRRPTRVRLGGDGAARGRRRHRRAAEPGPRPPLPARDRRRGVPGRHARLHPAAPRRRDRRDRGRRGAARARAARRAAAIALRRPGGHGRRRGAPRCAPRATSPRSTPASRCGCAAALRSRCPPGRRASRCPPVCWRRT